MSVETTADRHLNDIRRNLKQANKNLSQWLVDDDVWGREEYSEEFEDSVQEAINLIRKARKLLG